MGLDPRNGLPDGHDMRYAEGGAERRCNDAKRAVDVVAQLDRAGASQMQPANASLQRLHDLLFTAQRASGEAHSKAMTEARVCLSELMAGQVAQRRSAALVFADDRPTSGGDDLYHWAIDAENVIRTLSAQRDEADRRAGAAERELASVRSELDTMRRVRERMKEQWGAHYNTSFDVVWDEALTLKAGAEAAARAAKKD